MGTFSVFGGGFFYSPFTQLITTPNNMTTGVNLAYGPWLLTPVSVVARVHVRWMQINFIANTATSKSYNTQLGLGAPGAEVSILESAGGAGTGAFRCRFDNFSQKQCGWMYSFPVDIPPGVPLSVRCQSADSNLAETLSVIISAWG